MQNSKPKPIKWLGQGCPLVASALLNGEDAGVKTVENKAAEASNS